MNHSVHCKKVHKFNLFLTFCLIVLILAPLIHLRGFDACKLYIIFGIAVAGLAAVNYIVPTPDRVKGLLFALLPLTVVSALFFLDKFALNKHYILFFTVIMIALYFDKRLILIFSGIVTFYICILVANEVRDLAEQSREIASHITQVTHQIFEKSKAAQEKSHEGKQAVEEGQILLQEIIRSFNSMKESYENTNLQLKNNMDTIWQTTDEFHRISEQIESAVAITEENTAATEEIVSTLTTSHEAIETISRSTQQLKKLSQELIDVCHVQQDT